MYNYLQDLVATKHYFLDDTDVMWEAISKCPDALMYPQVCDILMGLAFVTVERPLETISSTNVAMIYQIYRLWPCLHCFWLWPSGCQHLAGERGAAANGSTAFMAAAANGHREVQKYLAGITVAQ